MYKNLPIEVSVNIIYDIIRSDSYVLKKLRNIGLNIINNSFLKKIMKYVLDLY
ncbi:MAG: hypothetical protein N4P87_01630 [Candidatus Lightella neohaematopini]|nr:hypothetical protein [Candidatus Lightella neohaematopini]